MRYLHERNHASSIVSGMVVMTIVSTALAGGACELGWDNAVGQPGTDETIYALTAFDDGNGPAIYAGGVFATAGGATVGNIAKWDGQSWSDLDNGIAGGNSNFGYGVRAMAVFDDGSGPALYVGGPFNMAGGAPAKAIAKWDGNSWSALGTGIFGEFGTPGVVLSLAVYDDGSGPALYAAGIFSRAGGLFVSNIAKWNGTSWSAVGSGLNYATSTMAVFDDGNGPALYASGTLTEAGGQPVNGIAKWDGSAWSSVGGGFGDGDFASDLTVFDDGTGPALYAGGHFTTVGGVQASGIARWNGTEWTAVEPTPSNSYFDALTVFDDGSGPKLYGSGNVDGYTLVKWTGSAWTTLAFGNEGIVIGNPLALLAFDDGLSDPAGGESLYIAGYIEYVGSYPPIGDVANNIARWGCVLAPPIPGDIDGDGFVNVSDLLAVINSWGACPAPPTSCPADVAPQPDGDGQVNVNDLLLIINNWG